MPLTLASGAQIKQSLATIEQRTGNRWLIFGDSAFGLSRYLQRMVKGLHRTTREGRVYNRIMASTRVTNEQAIGELTQSWAFIAHGQTNVLGSMPLAKHVGVAAVLHNCEGILYGNKMVEAMGETGEALREQMTICSYLSRAVD